MARLSTVKAINILASKRKRFPKFKPGMKIEFYVDKNKLETKDGYLWDHAPDGCWWLVTDNCRAVRVRCINTSYGSYWRAV